MTARDLTTGAHQTIGCEIAPNIDPTAARTYTTGSMDENLLMCSKGLHPNVSPANSDLWQRDERAAENCRRDNVGRDFTLIGEIAAMIDLGAQGKAAGPKGSAVPAVYRSSVKVVAGERNHLYRTAVRWP